ncbi:unnamed protein product [Didymodactylos carnosus]|uniref:TLDc domain-containing protein n=1 Tax=Didymodactylos carnosus TaxID=1234261 RepID=A0A8S2DSC3_9BILA|nr:unnamed protein product [Didymodactylos carnosus]CAF3768017.1 unnamed protein product [Didymodactylos carnosus]
MSGILPCKGCQRNFCQGHMNEHRQELEGDFQRLLSDRDLLYQQIYSEAPTDPQAFDYISKWERKTIEKIEMIADQARRQVQDLLDEKRLKVKEKYDQFSAELRQRKESSHFFEQDIEILSKTLEQVKRDCEHKATSTTVTVKARTIDFDHILDITLNAKTNSHQNQLFIGGTLLDEKQHQYKLNEFYGNQNQQWELIYKSTRDGFAVSDFHRHCDGKGPTMVVIQSKNGGYLFGGYTAVPWNSNDQTVADPSAFIFTLTNPNQLPITKFNIKPADSQYAVYHYKQSGPIFGPYRPRPYDSSDSSDSDSSSSSDSSDSSSSDIGVMEVDGMLNRSYIRFPIRYIDTLGHKADTFTGSGDCEVNEIEVYSLQ